MSYLTERFEAAVRALVGDGPIKQRLGRAYMRHLDDLQTADLPDPLRGPYAQLRAAMHQAAPIGKESSVKVTVRKMSFAEATEHAETIVGLYAQMLRDGDRVETLKVVHNDKAASNDEKPPPLYLSARS